MQSQPNTMIRSRRLIFAAMVLLSGLAAAGTVSIPSADLPGVATQLPKRAAQYAGETFALAQESVIGLMGVSVMNPHP